MGLMSAANTHQYQPLRQASLSEMKWNTSNVKCPNDTLGKK